MNLRKWMALGLVLISFQSLVQAQESRNPEYLRLKAAFQQSPLKPSLPLFEEALINGTLLSQPLSDVMNLLKIFSETRVRDEKRTHGVYQAEFAREFKKLQKSAAALSLIGIFVRRSPTPQQVLAYRNFFDIGPQVYELAVKRVAQMPPISILDSMGTATAAESLANRNAQPSILESMQVATEAESREARNEPATNAQIKLVQVWKLPMDRELRLFSNNMVQVIEKQSGFVIRQFRTLLGKKEVEVANDRLLISSRTEGEQWEYGLEHFEFLQRQRLSAICGKAHY
jgi:hypothetical protein